MNRKNYAQLTKDELYAIAKLRQEVFIVEQNSVYLDLDDKDQDAIHILSEAAECGLVCYGRYRICNIDKQVKIERVVIHKHFRGQGKGQELMHAILRDVQSVCPSFAIILSSQVYACDFYRGLGFVEYGEPYDDGGIEHINMQYVNLGR